MIFACFRKASWHCPSDTVAEPGTPTAISRSHSGHAEVGLPLYRACRASRMYRSFVSVNRRPCPSENLHTGACSLSAQVPLAPAPHLEMTAPPPTNINVRLLCRFDQRHCACARSLFPNRTPSLRSIGSGFCRVSYSVSCRRDILGDIDRAPDPAVPSARSGMPSGSCPPALSHPLR